MDDGLVRVYRFFATGPELWNFMEGSWQGNGVHGLAGASPEEGVSFVSRFSKGSLLLQLKSIPAPSKKKAFSSFLQSRFFRPSAPQSEIRQEWSLDASLAEAQMDVDLGVLHWPGHLQLAIQGLEEDRVHCQLELLDAQQKQLFFSGVIKRK